MTRNAFVRLMASIILLMGGCAFIKSAPYSWDTWDKNMGVRCVEIAMTDNLGRVQYYFFLTEWDYERIRKYAKDKFHHCRSRDPYKRAPRGGPVFNVKNPWVCEKHYQGELGSFKLEC